MPDQPLATESAAGRRGVFVVGTGTGVGKSIVAAAILAQANRAGRKIAAFKPVVTGLAEPDPVWPFDHDLLAAATGWQQSENTAPYTFDPAVSPHLAAELADTAINTEVLRMRFEKLQTESDAVVCEGVGGLLVPLNTSPRFTVLDLVEDCGLPVVVAARPGLGTINDCSLTVDRLRTAGLSVLAVVLSGWPARPSVIEGSNRETIEQLLELEVCTLPVTTPEEIGSAGDQLPVGRWLGYDGTAV